jgi:hypothetical protein
VVLEVRRDDGELCGYVAPQEDRWRSLTTFGAVLGEHDSEHEARQHAADLGLSALADRWTLIDRSTGEEELVCIQQVSPVEVTLALGYYSLPGVPTMTIRVEDLTTGRWRLEHRV